ncbi:MAG: hypothetical protein R6X13_01345 [bacterium]
MKTGKLSEYRQVVGLVVTGLLLAGAGCEPNVHREVTFRAPVVVTRGGEFAADVAVTFGANKMTEGGREIAGTRLNASRFTNTLGQASLVFGYNLEYDSEVSAFLEGARVAAMVEQAGTWYSDTAWSPIPLFILSGEYVLDTLRIELPPR